MKNFNIEIDGKKIGGNNPCYIVDEIGSNHNGSLALAKDLIRAAADSGADAVKFQLFRSGKLYVQRQRDSKGVWQSNPSFSLFTNAEFPESWVSELYGHSRDLGITFLSTPFDTEFANVLNSIDVGAFKIASGDLTNFQLIRHVSSFGKPVIIATGMSTMSEVEESVSWIQAVGNEKIAILHCCSLYPAEPKETNLKSIHTISKKFPCCPVGFSDHTLGITVPLGAVALGACIIEKHFTLKRNQKGLDHGHSTEPDEFEKMVVEIRKLERSLGREEKIPEGREVPERTMARRGVYAARSIKKGEVLSKEMIAILRPQLSIMPVQVNSLFGKMANRDIEADEPLFPEMFVQV